jgi:uncharacterized protein (TIGR02265 family)
LLVDPDSGATRGISDALRITGLEATTVKDAEAGLSRLAALEPEVLLLELQFPTATAGKDGIWLLRRLRDEYMGTRPRVVVTTRPEAIVGRVGDLGVDAVVLKPAAPEAVVAACAAQPADRLRETDILRELLRVSTLEGDLDAAFAASAKKIALAFRVSECVLVGTISDRQHIGCARGPIDESPDAPIWDLCRVALDAGAPVMAAMEGGVQTFIAVPIESTGGTRLGVIVLVDDGPRLFPLELIDSLRTLGNRLYGELAWRTVHDRIAADRDRLRESSMLDPLMGVWTKNALDQALPGEVSACQRRGESMCIAVLNLRGLRTLNEHHGHIVGDLALAHMAQHTRRALRTQDLVARYGGDSLVLVLAGAPLADARNVVQRLTTQISSTPLVHDGREISVTVVAGLAPLLGEDDTGEAAMARATWAMKMAKRRHEPLYVAEEDVPPEAIAAVENVGLEAGATLGGVYQILHEISRGAMGVVYRAEDLGLGRPVALKTLRPDLARDRNFVERFRIEAATLAAIRHEHLVQVYAFGQDREDVYFVMELVEGEPLEDRIEMQRHDGRHLPFDRVLSVVSEIGDALDAMHRAGILHRDVKPANILLDRVRDRAVLVDVGIAKRRGTEHDPAGTPGFTAPETFVGGSEGPSSDVYGLAATAYTMITGVQPFAETSLEATLAAQQARPPEKASVRRPGLPPAVDDVLLRAMHPDPTKRYGTARELAVAFGASLEQATPEVHAGRDHMPSFDHSDDVDVSAETGPAPPVVVVAPPSAETTNLGASGLSAPFDTSRPPAPGHVPALTRLVPAKPSTHVSSPGPLKLPSLREPDAPDPAIPHTRGVLFRSAYRVLGARQGAAWVAHVSRHDKALAQALQPQNTLLSWHPTEVFVTMLEQIAASGRDARAFSRELGRVATSVTFGRFFGADPAALSPGQVLSAADLFWRRYHTWGTVSVERVGDVATDVLVADGPRAPLVCAATAGILEQVAILSGASSAAVEHKACAATGATACTFHVTWELPRST